MSFQLLSGVRWGWYAGTTFADSSDTIYTYWEGAFRVPAFVRWPGKFEAGKTLNGIVTHQEWLPTLVAVAGDPDVKEKLLKGHQAGDKNFKVHIDGYKSCPT